ncbi:hypothetical protein Hrubri_0722 [Herbaspirillum rubrisubalbicans M1]|nr:hypothetical protein Hrubri_0722 [Herbaspirillum rubrisubalbicans M1]
MVEPGLGCAQSMRAIAGSPQDITPARYRGRSVLAGKTPHLAQHSARRQSIFRCLSTGRRVPSWNVP